jgi:peptidoglycan/LPS O-acetylase OafA/YrhL
VKRLHSLDALRGLAALSVVVWHWQHFFALDGSWPQNWDAAAQPFHSVLKPLYYEGWMAVDLFFALSGFVFFWLYGEAIREQRIGAAKFALLRFSRLYPLHFATLIAVSVLQLLFVRESGSFFIYTANDPWHFLVNLAFVQQWTPSRGDLGFNGPSWSVSVEVLLYGIFFVFCRVGLRSWQALALVALGLAIYHWNTPVARGLIGFFMGGLAFHASEILAARQGARRIAGLICAAALLAWGAVGIEAYWGPFDGRLAAWVAGFHDPAGRDYAEHAQFLAFILIVSPLSIMALALHEHVLGGRYGFLSGLGDISYSTYLLHFPLQLAVALAALRFGIPVRIFHSEAVMVGFFAVLIGLGALSYNLFERPAQAMLRGKSGAKTPPHRMVEP